MTISPTLIAGHAAVTQLLAGMDVNVKPVHEPVNAFTAWLTRGSVSVACWNDSVNVIYRGADSWGADDDNTVVLYPASWDDPAFAAKLGEVLLPVVERYLSRVSQA